MKLIKTFEKFRKNKLQVIQLTCTVTSKDDIGELQYSAYEANLFINHMFIDDISYVLDDAGLFTDMVDSVDWYEVYNEQHECVPEFNIDL